MSLRATWCQVILLLALLKAQERKSERDSELLPFWCPHALRTERVVLRCGPVLAHGLPDVFSRVKWLSKDIKSRAASSHAQNKGGQVSQVVAEAVLQDSHVADAVQL